MTFRLLTGRRGRLPLSTAQRAFTLVELLIAGSLACLLLAGSWGWVWTATASARSHERKAGCLTSTAFAERVLRADLARALRLASPSEGICSTTILTLATVDDATGATIMTKVAWDPGRRVVWQNASGSYLAEFVTAFAVRYLDGDGEELWPGAGGVLGSFSREKVESIRIEITQHQGDVERRAMVCEAMSAAGAE